MSAGLFEGSYLGDGARIAPAAKLECGVCWHVYDPAKGDAQQNVPPGTAFALLPEGWCCPDCAAPKTRFMVVDDPAALEAPDAVTVAARVEAAYRASDGRMRGLPVHNPALRVEAVGFRREADAVSGVIITPWMMNVLRVLDGEGGTLGVETMRAFPAGELPLIAGELAEVGPIESCSLFSPMDSFADQEAARLAAEAAIEALFTAPEPPKVDRRSFFRGGAAR